jgi:hypothetical protein
MEAVQRSWIGTEEAGSPIVFRKKGIVMSFRSLPVLAALAVKRLRAWLRYYDAAPELRGGRVIQSWDTAAKDGAQNDWSVCTTWLLVDNHFVGDRH